MTPKKSAAATEASEEEIDEIMDELEKLKSEMTDDRKETSEESRPDLKVVPDPEETTEANVEAEATEEPKMEDFHASEDHASMEDTVGHFKEEESGDDAGLLSKPSSMVSDDGEDFDDSHHDDPADHDSHDDHPSSNSDDGALTLSLKGNLNLKLNYEQGGQEVGISFQDNTLIVSLSNGAEFKIPMDH